MSLIDTNNKLEEKLKTLKSEELIGLDTEFVRQKTYFAKLCLIQISTPREYFAIDPLMLDISPLKEILESKNIMKIIHDPNQDLSIFYHKLGIITNNVFDTQEAARLSKIKNQISYREICEKILNVKIDKNQKFRDWAVRPLPKDMIDYALQDVKYLIPIYHKLKQTLRGAAATKEFRERMEEFSQKSFYINPIELAWKKIRIENIDEKFQNRLKAIATFREISAMKMDIPRKYFLSDEDILKIINKLPINYKEISELKLRKKIKPKFLEELFNISEGIKSNEEKK